ncbi:MAG: DASS family sodium-coupled anion symporter [Acidobacteria bacterium]|nr:DASS family sodium-coupled anion symporter [Acidobacteriota bacterium]
MNPAAAAALPAADAEVDVLVDLDKQKLSSIPARTPNATERWMEYLGFPLGLVLFGLLYLMPTPGGLTTAAQAALACFALAITWWVAEPVPAYVTSLLLMVLLVFTGAWEETKVLAVLGMDVIWLNVMAFILSTILIKTNLARRLALHLFVRFGNRASTMLLAFVLLQLVLAPLIPATAARAVMTLPLMLVVAAIYRSTAANPTNFGRNLFLQNLLGINILSSGFMTGSTANLLAVGFILSMGDHRVYYTDWMFANLPVAVAAMLIAWWLGPHLLFRVSDAEAKPSLPGGIEGLRTQLARLGPLTTAERKGLGIFTVVVLLWVTDRFHTAWFGFSIDPVMAAMLGVIITFAPRVGLLTWNDTDIPWHLMIFSAGAYAGGLALDQTGAAGWAIERLFALLNFGPHPNFWTVYVVVIAVNLYSHLFFTSKTMRTLIMLPVVIELAKHLGFPPVSLALPAAFTIDWVIGLPISAKPNLILFTTGQYSVLDNLKYGFVMTTIGVVLFTIAGMTWFRLLGITPGF